MSRAVEGPPEQAGDPIPEMYEQTVAIDVARQILFDVEAAAELVEVLIKDGARQHAREGIPDLATAGRALETEGAAVQLRYRHQGTLWWDTLMPVGDGRVRVVRLRPPIG